MNKKKVHFSFASVYYIKIQHRPNKILDLKEIKMIKNIKIDKIEYYKNNYKLKNY